jgi:toxin ParE1/3/4
MSQQYILTPQAASDVRGIWDYLESKASDAVADRVVTRIWAECDKLARYPTLGHFRDDLADRRQRFWSVWSYLIMNRWQTTPIQIIAIAHGARDLETLLDDRM